MLTRRGLTIGVTAAIASTFAGPAGARFGWPGGARTAVSLTYDDGYDSQLENVVPVLDAFGIKATFFLTVNNISACVDDWSALSKKGHEIGNHTLSHPCMLKDYYVQKAIDRGHWAILVFHEVVDRRRAVGDTSKTVHREILEALLRKPVWCAPMRTVFSYITGVA